MKLLHTLLTLCFITGLSSLASAQGTLPAGYSVQQNQDGKKNEIRADFNGDGKPDLFAIIQKGSESVRLFASISGPKGYKTISHGDLDFFDCCNRIEQKGAVIKVYSNGMRYFENYTFRYNKTSNTFDFIGYDNESFGNAVHDGAGTHSINMLTGAHIGHIYHADKNNPETEGTAEDFTRKYKMPKRFTLSDFPAAMKWIEGKVTQ